ncbi:Cytochrome c oxidase assembly protein cox15 [Dimargaris verticillata]|uniref:Cytochrome c oxidase assembly protein cox15 n=1 Tax=Dimargaris verticillata TaxID=2761393 RepID=A0A9W8B3H3_9FUNG|nr:Cytochrome c oxidase assembly protein cox15 [Dimargaris verticillata]
MLGHTWIQPCARPLRSWALARAPSRAYSRWSSYNARSQALRLTSFQHPWSRSEPRVLGAMTSPAPSGTLLSATHGLRAQPFCLVRRLLQSQTTGAAVDQVSTGGESSSNSQSAAGPQASRKVVGYWLMASAVSVFGIVVWGGVTRLTESGLSIVEWNLIRGMKPPRSEEDWEAEFTKYKQFPEYQKIHRDMTLEQFKFIYFMEWGHRMWGRMIGLTFILPAAYFTYKGWMTKAVKSRVWIIAGLVCFQGALGWYMVKSGLDHTLMDDPGAVPRVSQYRLAAHLGTAFLAYTGMYFTGLSVFRENNVARNRLSSFTSLVNRSAVNPLRHSVHGLTMLIFFTALSGAFVAGLDAGMLYDTFPLMGGRWVPPSEDLWSPAFADPHPTASTNTALPADMPTGMWRNLLENPTTVQFNHRVLAMTTFTAISIVYLYSRRLPLPRSTRNTLHALMALATAQVTLGILTLLNSVPTDLAAVHQAGSISLLTASLTLMHLLKKVPK